MFNFSFDKRILYVIIGIMILNTLVRYTTEEGALLRFTYYNTRGVNCNYIS